MISLGPPHAVSGFVLAGGHSSRMGQDKALLKLAGKTLVERAVLKLRQVCAQVCVLSANPALAAYAPIVPDLHPGCGPLSGMEAGLAHAHYDWSLILPVDVPFLPTAMLKSWVSATLSHAAPDGTRLAMHVVDGKPQPTLLMLHRDVTGFLSDALERGEYKVMSVLLAAAQHLAAIRELPAGRVFLRQNWHLPSAESPRQADPVKGTASSREVPASLYFVNLNTPEDFAGAERNAGALDTESW